MNVKRYDLQNFWKVPVYLPSLHDNLDPEKLQACEAAVGYKLPPLLVELLYTQNGGLVNGLGYGGFDTLWGIGTKFSNIAGRTLLMRADNRILSTDNLVALDGDGHSFICLDYRNESTNPKVIFVDFEDNTETFLADNFTDYILYDELDDFEWEDAAANPLFVAFADLPACCSAILQLEPSFTLRQLADRGLGYPEWQLWANGEVVCTLSANEVDKYYIGSNTDYAEVLARMHNPKALRYPDLPAASTVVMVAGDAPYELLSLLRGQFGTKELFDV